MCHDGGYHISVWLAFSGYAIKPKFEKVPPSLPQGGMQLHKALLHGGGGLETGTALSATSTPKSADLGWESLP